MSTQKKDCCGCNDLQGKNHPQNCNPFYWGFEEEVAAARIIKRKSDGRLLGATCKCCPLPNYYRHNVRRMLCWSTLFLIGSVIAVSVTMPFLAQMINYTKGFTETTCTTESSEISDVTLSCNCKAGKNGGTCTATYPCILINVTYIATSNAQTALLRVNIDALPKYSKLENDGCSFYKSECGGERGSISNTAVDYIHKYGSPGKTFPCFYNGENSKEVVLERMSFGMMSPGQWQGFIWGILLFSSGSLLLLTVALTCGWYHLVSKVPPAEIAQEVENMKSETGQGASGAVNPSMLDVSPAPTDQPPSEPPPPSYAQTTATDFKTVY